MKNHSPQRGFTYIELMVVAMIIAILAAILFPVFGQAQAKAHQVACAANLRNLHAAMVLYAREHHGQFPPGNDLSPLRPYLQDDSVLACPDDPRPLALSGDGRIEHCSYEYVGGFGLDSDPRVPIARCRDENHNGGAYWLLVDGMVKWIAPRSSGPQQEPVWEPQLGQPYERKR